MRPLSRRAFIALATALSVPRWARGQATGRICHLGMLNVIDASKEPYTLALVQRLRELGFAEGSNLAISRRHAGGKIEKLPSVGFTRASLHYLRLQPCLLSGSPGRCGASSNVAAQ